MTLVELLVVIARGTADKLPIGSASPNDLLSRLLAQMVDDCGWRVPDHVAIIGSMNEERSCNAPRPTITSVEVGYEWIGYEAGRLLDGLMQEADATKASGKLRRRSRKTTSPDGQPRHMILPPVALVVRESTDFYASGDDVVSQAQAFIATNCHVDLGVKQGAEKVNREPTTTDRSLYEIAYRVGFACDVRHCEAFKQEVGMSPGRYRKERQMRLGTGKPS